MGRSGPPAPAAPIPRAPWPRPALQRSLPCRPLTCHHRQPQHAARPAGAAPPDGHVSLAPGHGCVRGQDRRGERDAYGGEAGCPAGWWAAVSPGVMRPRAAVGARWGAAGSVRGRCGTAETPAARGGPGPATAPLGASPAAATFRPPAGARVGAGAGRIASRRPSQSSGAGSWVLDPGAGGLGPAGRRMMRLPPAILIDSVWRPMISCPAGPRPPAPGLSSLLHLPQRLISRMLTCLICSRAPAGGRNVAAAGDAPGGAVAGPGPPLAAGVSAVPHRPRTDPAAPQRAPTAARGRITPGDTAAHHPAGQPASPPYASRSPRRSCPLTHP
jgi:hypothetical protein